MNNRAPLVSIIIVTWNSKKYLPLCLLSLSKQTFRNFEIILVDNGSTDGTIQDVQSHWHQYFTNIKILRSNLGFAVANNIGVSFAKGKWIALLNTDAFPQQDWLEKLIEVAEKKTGYVAFSSRQIQYINPQKLDGAGDIYHISGLAWRNGYNLSVKDYGLDQKEIFSACAAAALYSREAFTNIGGFDEDFFSYFEDVDLGFRFRLTSAKCLYVPTAIVHHVGSFSTGRRSDFSIYYGYRNIVWTFFKNMPSPLFWIFLPLHIICIIFFIFYFATHKRAKLILGAIFDAIRGLPQVLEKRKIIQGYTNVQSKDLLKVMSTGFIEPYLEFIERNRK